MLQGILILISLYLPGHFLGRKLARKGDGLAELMLLRVAVSLSVAGPLLTLLALAGWFTAPAVVGSLVVCAVVAFLLGRREGGSVRGTRWDVGALALVAGSFALYSRPAEYVINSRDPGVYTLFADRLVRTGALLHRDPLVAAVAPFHQFVEGKKYPGFFIYGQDLIVPQFFPAPFAFLGFGNLVGDLWGSLFVVPVMGALSIGMAFVLGRGLFGGWAGLVGAALLAASYTQVWWARHPSSEMMAQLFVLAGLWLAARFARGSDRITGVLAGLVLGGAMLVRVDAFLAATAIPLLFGYDLLTRRPARRWLYPGVPLALFAGAALLYLNTIGGRYLYVIYTEHGLREALALTPYIAGMGLLLLGVFLLVRHLWGERMGAWLRVRGGRVALVGALGVVAVALWAYFVLPVPWESLPEDLRSFDAYRSQVVVRIVWFVTPLVAVLGLVGLLLAARRLDAARALFLGAVLSFGILYVAIPNVAPDLPWATRRFVPAVFPGLALLAGYATVELGCSLGRIWDRRAGIAVSGALATAAFAWTVLVASPVLGVRELGGAVEAFERVNHRIPAAEVVYMEMPDGFDFTASTFEYVYDRPVLPYDRIRFIREVEDLEEAGLLEDAVYVTTDGSPAPLVSGLGFREVDNEEVNLPRLSPTEGYERALPTKMETLQKHYRVYRIEDET